MYILISSIRGYFVKINYQIKLDLHLLMEFQLTTVFNSLQYRTSSFSLLIVKYQSIPNLSLYVALHNCTSVYSTVALSLLSGHSTVATLPNFSIHCTTDYTTVAVQLIVYLHYQVSGHSTVAPLPSFSMHCTTDYCTVAVHLGHNLHIYQLLSNLNTL